MPFTVLPSRRFPVQYPVSYNAGGDTTTRYGPIGLWGCGRPLGTGG